MLKSDTFDLSEIEHDKQYRTSSNIEWHKRFYERCHTEGHYRKMGFELVFGLVQRLAVRRLVDIGAGAGGLLNYGSRYFNSLIGVEPSSAAIETAKALFSEDPVIWMPLRMMEFSYVFPDEEPTLITTSAVLSHIPDDHVQAFLEKLCAETSLSTILYFYEPYGKDIQNNLWYVRDKTWWIARLPNFLVFFLDIPDSGFKKGILAFRVSNSSRPDVLRQKWFSRLYNIASNRIVRHAYKTRELISCLISRR